jgi:hypothetical protein
MECCEAEYYVLFTDDESGQEFIAPLIVAYCPMCGKVLNAKGVVNG